MRKTARKALEIEELRMQIQAWRDSRTKHERMPRELWEEAMRLAASFGAYPTLLEAISEVYQNDA